MQCNSVLHYLNIVVGFGTMGRNMIIGAKETLDREHIASMICIALAFY